LDIPRICVEEAYAAGQTEPVEPYRPETLHEPGFKQWLKAQRPDAIITIHDYIKPWVERAGFNVPEDIGIAHLDCNHAGKSVFSGINQHSDLMGKLTLDLVAEQLDKNERGLPDVPKTVIYRGSWVDGGTTRQQPM
jgi:LacI family transcriptional regulator